MKTIAIQKNASIQNVRMLTMTAVLSAIAFVLAFFEFPVPLSPSFARMDLSDLPRSVYVGRVWNDSMHCGFFKVLR